MKSFHVFGPFIVVWSWSFGAGDLGWAFGIRVFSLWGLGPVVRGLMGSLGLGLFTYT